MTLHPEAQKMLDELAALGLPDLREQSVAEVRARLGDPLENVVEVSDVVDEEFTGPGSMVSVRRYVPVRDEEAPLNLVVFFHGGGWVIGSLDSHDGLARRLSAACHAVVVSVDYRLAPESRFPAAVDDCLAAVTWATGQSETWGVNGQLGVAGDSAGGNLAAVVARACAAAGTRLDRQVLLYPVTDSDLGTTSYRQFSEGFGLTRDAMAWFWEQYMGDADATQPDASPMQAAAVDGLAPAYVVTAEYDTLRDEGDSYARKLQDDGVDVTYECVPGVLHGFLLHGHRFSEVGEVADRVGAWFRDAGTIA